MKYLYLLFTSFLFATAALAQGNYGVQAGDSLRIEVLEDANLNKTVLVTPDGRFSFPLAGTIQASGRTVEQIERNLSSKLASNFANPPTVYVAVGSVTDRVPVEMREPLPDMMTIYLLGEVANPGPKEVEAGLAILQVLSTSGGFSKFAATKRVQIRRRMSDGREKLVRVNYHALERGAALVRDVVLHDGDVILVPERRLFE